ncbi:MAG: transglutaminase domain-containing protein, partial [Myxococcota bacterium]
MTILPWIAGRTAGLALRSDVRPSLLARALLLSLLLVPVIAMGASAQPANEVVYSYDELNRLTRADNSNGNSISYNYDAAGNREQVIFVPEPQAVVTLAAGSLLLLFLDGKRRRRTRPRLPDRRLRSWRRRLSFLVLLLYPVATVEPASAVDSPGLRKLLPPTVAGPLLTAPPSAGGTATAQALRPLASVMGAQSSTSTESTPEIQALARALKYDVDLIYEYVYSKIEYDPIWGSNRGAMGTLLDGKGNDFDQASLMIALLRESSYVASFMYGQVTMFPATLVNWLGIPNDAFVLFNLLQRGGRLIGSDFTYVVGFSDSTINFAVVERVWVKVNIGGTDYVFDPAFKTHTVTPAIDLEAAMQYGQGSFLASVGATVTTDYIQNVNQTNLEDSLAGYASNLAANIRSNYSGATLNDIVGGRTIDPLTVFPRNTSLPLEFTSVDWGADIPGFYRATLQIQVPALNPAIDETFYADSLSGKRLTLFYESNQPVLRLDGLTIATGTSATGTQDIQLTARHPFPFGFADQTGSATVEVGGSFLIGNGWSDTRAGRVKHHERRLRANTHAGGGLLSEPVLGESLAVLATSWLAEESQTCSLAGKVGDTHTNVFHEIMIAGQVASPYMDVRVNGRNSVGYAADAQMRIQQEDAMFFHCGGMGSAFEGGVIRQTQDHGAVSTVELIGISTDQSDRIFNASQSNF